jgi:DnaJ-class molecular chaperone
MNNSKKDKFEKENQVIVAIQNSKELCPVCKGEKVLEMSYNHYVFTASCPDCFGTGKLLTDEQFKVLANRRAEIRSQLNSQI